jgi:hypothetical protein
VIPEKDILDKSIADLTAMENDRRRCDEPTLTTQQRIDWINRRMVELGHDPKAGIVAGDGNFYPRGEDGSPFGIPRAPIGQPEGQPYAAAKSAELFREGR